MIASRAQSFGHGLALVVACVCLTLAAGCTKKAPAPAATPVPTGLLDHSALLSASPSPAPLRAGVPTTWTLCLRDQSTGDTLRQFDVVHEKLLHLLIAARDLSWFNHIHPALQPDGTWRVEFALPRPGTYRLYADYTRAGGRHEVISLDVTTSEPQASAMSPAVLTPDVLDAQGFISRAVLATPEGHPEATGGEAYTVKLMPMPAYIAAKQPVMLHAMVLDAQGQPVRDLEPYLGAMGHAVLLSEDGTRFLHTHPMGDSSMANMPGMGAMPAMTAHDSLMLAEKTGPNVMFHTQFPEAGRYKLWLQFQHHGAIVTAPFVLGVQAAK